MYRMFLKSKKLEGKNASVLVEALLSVVILSVAITVIIQSMTAALRSHNYSLEYGSALMILENNLSAVMATGLIDGVEEDFTAPDGAKKYVFEIEPKLGGGEGENFFIQEFDAKVSWESKNVKKNILSSGYILNDQNIQ